MFQIKIFIKNLAVAFALVAGVMGLRYIQTERAKDSARKLWGVWIRDHPRGSPYAPKDLPIRISTLNFLRGDYWIQWASTTSPEAWARNFTVNIRTGAVIPWEEAAERISHERRKNKKLD